MEDSSSWSICGYESNHASWQATTPVWNLLPPPPALALGGKVVTPLSRRRRSEAPNFFMEPGKENIPAEIEGFSPARRNVLPRTPFKAARISGPVGQDSPPVLPLPALDYQDNVTAMTPDAKIAVGLFTPPPAPCAEQRQRQLDEDVKTALSWNSVPLLSLSLLHGGRACSCRSCFDHSIHEAVNQHHVSALEFLLSRNVVESINEVCGGFNPLYRAIRLARVEGDMGYRMASLLLEHGARHDVATQCGSTPLHEAAANSSLAAVQLLLGYGANPNASNALGRTALHIACCRTPFSLEELQIDVVEALLAGGANPLLSDNSCMRPVDLAIQDASMLRHFMDPGTDGSLCCQRLIRAEHWWRRRPALLIRLKSSGNNLVTDLPDPIFHAVVRFL